MCSTKFIAQDYAFVNPDAETKCELIKEGTFLSTTHKEIEWNMVANKNTQTEFYDNGKQFIKAIQNFDTKNPCKYELIVSETSDQFSGVLKGDKIKIEILYTEGNFIRIKSETNNQGIILTLEKIK